MSTTVMDHDRSRGMWEITSRTIVYAAIGAALYAVLAQIQFPLPGTANVSLRPGFAIVTFFGFAFGPIVGLFTGLVGLLAGVLGVSLAGTFKNRLLLAAVAAIIAVLIGFLFVFTDMLIGSADSFGTALTANYLPVVIGNAIVAGILTPILVAAWDPIKDSLGR